MDRSGLSAFLPRVVRSLAWDAAVRQVNPWPPVDLLGLALLVFSYPRLLFLEYNGKACRGMLDNAGPSSSLVVQLLSTDRSASNPRLRDIHLRWVRDFDPLAVDRLDLARLLEELSVDLAQTHSSLGNGQVARLLEIEAHLAGHLLLGPLHLGDSVVDRLAGNLPRKHDELLDAGGKELALMRMFSLRGQNALLPGQAAATADELHDLLALPADAVPWVRVQSHGRVIARADDGNGPAGGLFSLVHLVSSIDFVLKDAAFGLGGEVAVDELGALARIVEVRADVGRHGRFFPAAELGPGLRHVIEPFVPSLDAGSDGAGKKGRRGAYSRRSRSGRHRQPRRG
jgi:hypothetical protein